MENATFIGLSRQIVLRRAMEVIANNVANTDTTAYKRNRIQFKEYLVDTQQGDKMSFVLDSGTSRVTSEGEFSPTNNPLDVAITGPGYFVVEGEEGNLYTRNGHLRLDADGNLVTPQGKLLLNADGQPIVLPQQTTGSITIAPDGTVSAAGVTYGKLDLVTFENEQALQMVGDGMYQTDEVPIPATEASLLQGMVEKSNVQPIVEMTKMIEVLRAYQSINRLLQTEHELQRRAIQRLSGTA